MTRQFPVTPAPHARPPTSVPDLMRTVLYALAPTVVCYAWLFGWGVIVNIVLAGIAAGATEAGLLKLRARPWRPALGDYSALVTAVLIALALPPLLPWWIPVLAAVAAIALGKQAYGGLGANLFNPAMVGYVVVLLSFPAELVQWTAPRGTGLASASLGLGQQLAYAFAGRLPDGAGIDALTQATPLDVVRVGLTSMLTVGEIRVGPLFGTLGGAGWQSLAVVTALGGAYLLYRRIIGWQIPLALLAGMLVPAALMHVTDTSRFVSPAFHLFNGSTMLGAFFIATDPVTAAASARGRLVYGAGIGVLTYAIRTWGGYPDGLAFAVLLMNASVPLIDRYTAPRIYGHD
ncbi:MAG TPA: RnfABCDGE type electron transport complex subunit D [Gammaproteobacteria bacterium]|nr:RnfABCDGE type electron transport complex subunit D [Gammaproteobacteria bacterium]